MNLRDIKAADIDAVFFDADELAEPAQYNDVDILVIADPGEGTARNKPFDTEKTYEDAVFSVREADVPMPAIGDVVTYKGKDWEFVTLVESSVGRHRIRCVANGSAVHLGGL
ncbi:MAG: hypothetical protein E6713_02960 [Sporomusaceae bacterium]|nr:hypothetical protein [Sporomusaceae bacterium]